MIGRDAVSGGEPRNRTNIVHDLDRMPIVFSQEDEARWLDPDTPTEELLALLMPYPPEMMKGFEVDRSVGNGRLDDPLFVQPIPDGASLSAARSV
jgi:putative SOS response-associated peptidase YedK